MENRTDCQNQISGDTRPVSSEGSLPSTLPEKRIFRHFLWLTLLHGIIIGITLTLFGALLYIVLGFIPFAFDPTSPIIYRLLGPLMLTSCGFVPIVSWRVQRLCRLHPVLQPFHLIRYSPSNDNIGLFLATMGLFLSWSGFSMVIMVCFFPGSSIWYGIEIVGMAVILLVPSVRQLFLFIKKLRTTQS